MPFSDFLVPPKPGTTQGIHGRMVRPLCHFFRLVLICHAELQIDPKLAFDGNWEIVLKQVRRREEYNTDLAVGL